MKIVPRDCEPAYQVARSILGDDLIAPEEIACCTSTQYTRTQMGISLSTFPSRQKLCELKENGYGLVPRPPEAQSILSIRNSNPAYFYSTKVGWKAQKTDFGDEKSNLVPQEFAWYEKGQPFAEDALTGCSNWLAIRKDLVHGSRMKGWGAQESLLTKVEYAPEAAELCWFMAIFAAVRGIWLFENISVRTASRDAEGNRVYLGHYPHQGIILNSFHMDGHRSYFLAITSGRKL